MQSEATREQMVAGVKQAALVFLRRGFDADTVADLLDLEATRLPRDADDRGVYNSVAELLRQMPLYPKELTNAK
jgi:hypothetical protein